MSDKEVTIDATEFASGQEPETAEDFATLVRATFTVQGKALARCLGKQMRVLDRALLDTTPRRILNAVERDREVMQYVERNVKNFVARHIRYELGEDAPRMTVDVAQESDLPYTVAVDSKQLAVKVEMEFDVVAQ